MRTSDKVAEIGAALAKAQAAMRAASKDAKNPHFNSKYADLNAVWDSIREPLTANGISVLQDVENQGAAVMVTTRLQHLSGEYFEFGPLAVPMSKADAHGVGSACTYGRRFGLSAAVGVVADADDDGNGAVDKGNAKDERKRRPEPPQAPPAYEVVTAAQADAIRSAAKGAGIKDKDVYLSHLMKFAGVNDATRVPAEKLEYVLEQFALLGAPVPA